MKISIRELRSLIRESVDKSYVDPNYARLKSLAAAAIADLKAGGDPEEVYTWLAAETDLGRGQHRADAVVGLVRKVDPAAAADLEHAGRDFRSAPRPTFRPIRTPRAPLPRRCMSPMTISFSSSYNW